MQVYGITGLAGSGKDEATRVFEKKGYQHISLSDCLREELKKNQIEIIRENLINYANNLRKRNPAAMAEIAIKKITSDKVVFSSIRNIGEVEFLKSKYPKFKMIKIEAKEEIRFQRLKKRGREGASQTLEEFKAESEKDRTTGVNEVVNNTQMIIPNNGSLEKLQKMIELFIESDNRPDWDEYFLGIADAVGRRADCCRGRLGTILVRNKRILTAGYNGSPAGTPECSKVGCLIHEFKDEEDNIREGCIRTAHSDINAIVQAALHGVSTKGATLYGYYKPCFNCAKAIVQAGIVRVVVRKNYHDKLTDKLFKEAGIKLEIINPEELGTAPGK